MRKSKDYYRNKHILGELTLEDLTRVVEIEGDFSIGKNWLPITRTRVSRRRRVLSIFMDSIENDPSLEIPLTNRVRVVGDIITTRVDWGWGQTREVRLKLDGEVSFL